MENIKIINLIDMPEYIDEVSTWIWEEWENVSLEDIIYRTKHSILENDIPQMYVAIKDNKPIGVVSLWRTELKSRQDLTPWLATLFVKKEYRNLGVAKKLQGYVLNKTKELGYEKLYLTTTLDNYYEKYGWKFLEHAPKDNGSKTKIYYILTNDIKY